MLLATSLADWTKCLLATGLLVLEEATRQMLHREEVYLATVVAADNTCRTHGVRGHGAHLISSTITFLFLVVHWGTYRIAGGHLYTQLGPSSVHL